VLGRHLPLGAERRDERALGVGVDDRDADAGVEAGDRRVGRGDALGLEGRADLVAEGPGPDGTEVDDLGAVPRGGGHDVEAAAGGELELVGVDVTADRRHRGHAHDEVDDRLPGVQYAAHQCCSVRAVVRAVVRAPPRAR